MSRNLVDRLSSYAGFVGLLRTVIASRAYTGMTFSWGLSLRCGRSNGPSGPSDDGATSPIRMPVYESSSCS